MGVPHDPPPPQQSPRSSFTCAGLEHAVVQLQTQNSLVSFARDNVMCTCVHSFWLELSFLWKGDRPAIATAAARGVVMPGRTKFQFPFPLIDMPQYFSPNFHPSIHTAPVVEPNGSRRCPVGRPLEYEFETVATSPSRPPQTPSSLLTALGRDDSPGQPVALVGQFDQTTFVIEQARDALSLIGPRRGEYRLRDELRRGLRPWGHFQTAHSNDSERSCKLVFFDWVEVWDGVNPRERMPLAFPDHAPCRNRFKPSEQRTSLSFITRHHLPRCKFASVGDHVDVWNCIDPPETIPAKDVSCWTLFRRKSDFAQRSYFECYCRREFEAALVAWPWGDDAVILMERVEAICVDNKHNHPAFGVAYGFWRASGA